MTDLSSYRLIVWDLDGTLWRGSIDSGTDKACGGLDPTGLHELIPVLDRLGVVNTVCSNNERQTAESHLRELGILDRTVLRRIDWDPKPRGIEWILRVSRFQTHQVLFVDDSDRIRAEVSAATGIDTAAPLELLLDPVFLPEPTRDDSRIPHYRMLEAAALARERHGLEPDSADEAFLASSGIRVSIDLAPDPHKISRLSMRSNQLNFTRSRLTSREAQALIESATTRCVGVSVRDRFGDYGLVGFSALSVEGVLEHFFCSCRVLNMGVDSWMWSRSGFAPIREGLPPRRRTPTWILEDAGPKGVRLTDLVPVLTWLGGCDLDIIAGMVDGGGALDDAWPVENEENVQVYARSSVFVLEDGPIRRSASRPPWISKSIPPMIDRMTDIVIWSLWADYWSVTSVVRDPRGGERMVVPVPPGRPLEGGVDLGDLTPELFSVALTLALQARRPGQQVVLLNCPDFRSERRRESGQWVHDHHAALNAAVDAVVAAHESVHLVDVRELVRGEADLAVKGQAHVFHYRRECYVELAARVGSVIAELASA